MSTSGRQSRTSGVHFFRGSELAMRKVCLSAQGISGMKVQIGQNGNTCPAGCRRRLHEFPKTLCWILQDTLQWCDNHQEERISKLSDVQNDAKPCYSPTRKVRLSTPRISALKGADGTRMGAHIQSPPRLLILP